MHIVTGLPEDVEWRFLREVERHGCEQYSLDWFRAVSMVMDKYEIATEERTIEVNSEEFGDFHVFPESRPFAGLGDTCAEYFNHSVSSVKSR